MGLLDIFKRNSASGVVADTVKSTITGFGEVVDRFVHTKEEKAELDLAIRELALKQMDKALEQDSLIMKDRASARAMNSSDPMTPRILTLVFTLGYFGITAFMFSIVMKMFNQDMNDFVVSFISSIFGAFNAIMIQIISYYFGASKGGDEQGAKIADNFNKATKN